jgi:microsomal dipeptidase-like Zn-dependent dipeptidase
MNPQTLHQDAIVIDGLVISNWSRSVFEDMQRGGLTAANCTCSVWEGFRSLVVKKLKCIIYRDVTVASCTFVFGLSPK